VGDGKQIRIWGDRWIPIPSTFQVQSQPGSLPQDALVSSLIDLVTGGWNVALIRASFNATEADVICSLVPSPLGNADKNVWIASPNGCFTVKSAYHSEMKRRAQAWGEGSGSSRNTKIWQAIWNLKAPEVYKNFAWKMCNNILPTKVNLQRKHVVQDSICPICYSSPEDLWHTLWSCPAAVAVWQKGTRHLQKMGLTESDGNGVFHQWRSRLDEEGLLLSLAVARAIWLRRNAFVFDKVFTSPKQVMCQAQEAVIFFLSCHDPFIPLAPHQAPIIPCWFPPSGVF
jgi:hypothetical protein